MPSVMEHLRSIDKESELRALVAKHVESKDVEDFMRVLDEPQNEPLDFAAAERVCAFSRANKVAVRLYKELVLFFVDLGYQLKKERGQKTKLVLPPPDEEPAVTADAPESAAASASLAGAPARFSLSRAVEAAFTYVGESESEGFTTPATVASAINRPEVTPERVVEALRKIVASGAKSGTLVLDTRGGSPHPDHERFRLRRTRKWYQNRRLTIPESAAPIPSR